MKSGHRHNDICGNCTLFADILGTGHLPFHYSLCRIPNHDRICDFVHDGERRIPTVFVFLTVPGVPRIIALLEPMIFSTLL
jgi:hypothetical protein